MDSVGAWQSELSSAFLDDSRFPERIVTLTPNPQALEHGQDVSVSVSRHGQCCRLTIFIVCVMLSFLGFVCLLTIVISQWKQQTSYRLWLILGLMSYSSVLLYKGWGLLVQFGEETLLIQVTIESTRAFTLYLAVCERVASIAASTHGAPVSRDMEAGLEYDATFGRSSVKLGFWGRRGKTVRINITSQALPARKR